MKVTNMIGRSGRAVSNQFIVQDVSNHFIIDEFHDIHLTGRMFQSYGSNIAFISYDNRVLLDNHYWDYSITTGKYRNQFLGETKKETQAKINNGTYILTDLN